MAVQLGVLFCDQVGSTALLTRLGDALAEEVRRDLFQVLYRAASLCRGEVIKSSGDGLMVVFPSGADDALACGELMLAMVGRLARRELWSDVCFKVGVSAGDAVFDKGDWYGAAVNLAARLCAAAEPGQILASTPTLDGAARTDTSGWQALASLTLKGFPEPVAVGGLSVGNGQVASWPMPTSLDTQGTAAFVGQQRELDELQAFWGSSSGETSRHITVIGEPGVGVSRLLAEFADRVAAGEALVLTASSGGGPGWVEQLVRSYAATATLTRLRADAGTDAAALAALCPLVGLRLGVTAQVGPLNRDEVLLRLLTRIGDRTPVLVVLDGIATPPQLSQALPAGIKVVSGLRAESAVDVAGPTVALDALSGADVDTLVRAALPATFIAGTELTSFVMAETAGVARDVIAVTDELTRQQDLDQASAFDAVRRAVPYKGLQVFDDGDAVRFHGRDGAINDVMGALETTPFVAVVGSSGSGKSSVIRAGCLPRLAAAGHTVVVISPGDDPLRSLTAGWAQATGQDDGDILSIPDDGRSFVLVVDQLEECFTLAADEASRDRFLDLITTPTAGLRVLASLRGDFYGRASEHAGLAEALRTGTVLMAPPTSAELRAVIEAPAAAAHLQLEPGLSDLILTDVTDRPGSLPLLSHALRETWRLRHENTLSIKGYRQAGGATGAIARTADTVYNQLTSTEQDIAKRLFLRLTALGEGAEDSRRRVPVDVLAASSEDTIRVLHVLTAARLVTADTDAEGRDVDELAHEALLREWPRLREWLDEDRDELRTLAHLETAARDWDTAGQPDTDLYTGTRLEAAETIKADKLNDREKRYLSASIAMREAHRRQARRSRRRLQTFAVVLVVLLVVASLAGVIAIGKGNDARKKTVQAQRQSLLAETRGLSAQASALLHSQPDVALLLAVEAQRLHPSTDTLSGLLNVLSATSHVARIARGFGDHVEDLALSPDGRTAAVAYTDGSLQLWDFARQTAISRRLSSESRSNQLRLHWFNDRSVVAAWNDGLLETFDGATGQRLATKKLPVLPGAHGVVFSTDGKLLAVADARENLQILRWPSLQLVSSAAEHAGIGISDLAFNPRGTQLAIGSPSGVLHILDPRTGRDVVPEIATPTASYDGLDYSPDGRTLAAGSASGIVTLFDSATGRPRGALGGHTGHINRVQYSSNGEYLASTASDETVVVSRTRDGSEVGVPFIGHTTGAPGTVLFTGNSQQVVSAAPHEVITWDLAGRTALPRSSLSATWTTRLSVDPSRNLLFAAGDKGRIQVWNSKTLEYLGASERLNSVVQDMAVDPVHGRLAATISGGTYFSSIPGGGIDILSDTASPTVMRHLPLAGTAQGVSFSPSGDLLAVSTDEGALCVFDLRKADPPIVLQVSVDPLGGDTVGWTSDGTRILSAGISVFAVVDFKTGKVVLRENQRLGTFEGTLRPSSRDHTIAVSTYQGAVELFNPDGSPSSRRPLLAASSLWDSVISPDGLLVAGGGVDGTVTLWSLPAGQRVASALPLTEGYTAVAFLDKDRLVAAGANDTLDVIELSPSTLAKQACAIVGRNLTRQEFDSYLGFEPYHRTCPQWPSGT